MITAESGNQDVVGEFNFSFYFLSLVFESVQQKIKNNLFHKLYDK